MKIKEIKLNNFRRFTDLTITDISEKAKLIVVIGPNGSGKTALFDAFNHWYSICSQKGWCGDAEYTMKDKDKSKTFDISQNVKILFHGNINNNLETIKKSMYFRTAYRNDPDFNISALQGMPLPYDDLKIRRFIQNDQTVSENYQRLISRTLAGVYEESNNTKTIKDFREELIGAIKTSMAKVFDDLLLNDIGDPLSRGAFYFQKGTVKRFHYKNLSGGEKSAFDLLLDIIIKKYYFPEAIYCIDEPEAHMHTELQGRLLEELFNLIPPQGQLWINTHSLGMMRKARQLMQNSPELVAFIDFHKVNFDESCVLSPVCVDKAIWEKFLSIALEDIGDLLHPKHIILCEGNKQGRKYKNFDAVCYSKMFASKYPDVTFISAGSCNDIENENNVAYLILKELLPKTQITRLIDRDDRSESEISECIKKGIKVLKRRHIESYLLDPEIIEKLCQKHNATPEKIAQVSKMMSEKIENSRKLRGNAPDDIKSASGEIFVELKRILSLTQCGNTVDAFMRDTLSPLVTEQTAVFKELEQTIF